MVQSGRPKRSDGLGHVVRPMPDAMDLEEAIPEKQAGACRSRSLGSTQGWQVCHFRRHLRLSKTVKPLPRSPIQKTFKAGGENC